jgi:hypothetical protein
MLENFYFPLGLAKFNSVSPYFTPDTLANSTRKPETGLNADYKDEE